jgi:DNA-binding response OmpR family regulator
MTNGGNMENDGKKRRRGVVIEDDAIMGRMLRSILRDAEFQTTLAPTGLMGLDLVKQGNVDFVVLDVLIPEMNGFEVYEAMKNDPNMRDIPVLMITAWDDDKHMQRVRELGVRHFLPKPFTEDELLEKIKDLLKEIAD